MKKIRANILYALIVCIAAVGCQKADQNEKVPPESNYLWEQQLDKVLHTPHELLVKSNIRLTSYEVLDVVDSPDKVARYAALLKSEKPMLPYYSQSATKSGSNEVKISTISKAKAIGQTKSGDAIYTFTQGDKAIDSIMSQEDLRILRLTWDNNGTKTESLCAVSDKTGIAYDHFMSNVIIAGSEIITTKTIPDINTATKSDEYGNTQLFTGWKEWTLYRTFDHIFDIAGSSVTIRQTVYFIQDRCDNNRVYADCTKGACNGDVRAIAFAPSSAEIAYAYGFTSYDIRVEIYMGLGGGYVVEFSRIAGCNTSATGFNTIYPR